MHVLDTHEIKKIEQRLVAAEVSNESLSVDLIDHICCMIEERLDVGISLASAEEEVFSELGSVQLKSIELETKRLTQNKFIMKKRTKIVGLVGLSVTATGFIFKMLHLWGAGVLWGSGILIMAFGFFSMLLVDRFSYEKDTGRRITAFVGYIGAAMLLVGLGMSLLRMPFSNYLAIAGGVVLLIHFVISSSQARITDSAG